MRVFAYLVGPTCSGKNTMIERARERRRFRTTVSCTTREQGAGEIDGVHYHFISVEEFEARIERGEFIEHAKVHGNYYGTLASNLYSLLATGEDVIFDIDFQGARQLKEEFPDGVGIFIAPPSEEVLRQRLRIRNRGETEEKIEKRIATAREEMKRMDEFNYVIVNDDLDRAMAEFHALLAELEEGGTASMMRYRNPTALRGILATFA